MVRIEQVEETRETRVAEVPATSEEHRRWAQWRLSQLVREQFSIDWSQDPATRLMGAVRASAKWIAVLLTAAWWLNSVLM